MVSTAKTAAGSSHLDLADLDAPAAAPRRGLVIGNSYAIALKDGLEDSELPCRQDFSFLCAPGSELKVDVRDGVIRPTSERSMSFLAQGLPDGDMRIEDYDIFVLAGLNVSAGQTGRVYRSWRMAKHAPAGSVALISRPALRAAVEGLLRKTIAHRVAMQLRAWTAKPIVIVPQPNPIERLLTVERTTERLQETYERWSLYADSDMALELYDVFVEAAERAFGEIPATFREQPPSTRNGFFTRDDYQMKLRTTYDRSLQTPNAVEDVTHMNADFGRLTMELLWAEFSAEAAVR